MLQFEFTSGHVQSERRIAELQKIGKINIENIVGGMFSIVASKNGGKKILCIFDSDRLGLYSGFIFSFLDKNI